MIKTGIKVSRYQLLFDDDNNEITFKQCNQILFQLQKEMMQIANRAIQLYWEDDNLSNNYKKENGKFPDKELVFNERGCSFRNYVYRKIVKEFNKNNTRNISTILQDVGSKYRQSRKNYFLGNESICSYKSTIPIKLHKTNIKISKSNNDYCIKIGLLSKAFQDELYIKHKPISFKLRFGKSWYSKQIFDSILSGEFSHTSSDLIYKNDKWFLNLGYSAPERGNVKFIEGRTMGIDLGIVTPVVMAFNDNPVHLEIDSNEISEFRKQMIARRASLGRQTKYCADSKIGHGVHKRIEGIEKLKQTESNFRDRINHQYSRYIVDIAVKYKCKTIQMEDLSGISKDSTFLKSWPYFDLQTKIEYKAKENGINVIKINPKFTSQRCSKCGYISEDNRPEQSVFLCKKCGFGLNADWNAALNIATPGIEEIIKNSDTE